MKKQLLILFATIILCQSAHAQWTDRDIRNLDRRYSEVSWAITHNGFNNPEMGATLTDAGGKNQEWGITQQLHNGIRGLQIDVHYARTRNIGKRHYVLLAHGALWHYMGMCESFLPQIKTFLEKNPHEIITLRIQVAYNKNDLRHVVDSFSGRGPRCRDNADVSKYIYRGGARELASRTIRSLIDSNQRLVVMTEKRYRGMPAWMIDEFGPVVSFQNTYRASSIGDLYKADKFDINFPHHTRGDRYAEMLTINNFATSPPFGYGSPDRSRRANTRTLDKAIGSWLAYAKRPSLTADFVDVGDFVGQMKTINRLGEIKGRFIPASPETSGGAKPSDVINRLNEIAGSLLSEPSPKFRSKLRDVIIKTNTAPNGLKIYGAQATANGGYSFPLIDSRSASHVSRLPYQPHQITTIEFAHPRYDFYPPKINLAHHSKNSRKVIRQNIYYWQKGEPMPKSVQKRIQ